MNFEPTPREEAFFRNADLKETIYPHRRVHDLSAARRKRIPDEDFALPGRRYPIDTLKRARAALSYIGQHGTPDEIRTVRRKVHARWPEIDMPEFREDEAA